MNMKETIKNILLEKVKPHTKASVLFGLIQTQKVKIYSNNKSVFDDAIEDIEFFKMEDKNKDALVQGILNEVLPEIQEREREERKKQIQQNGPFMDYMPFICSKSGDYFLYCSSTESIAKLSVEALMKKLDKDEKEVFRDEAEMAYREYDPYDITPIKDTTLDGKEITRVNTYIAPPWRKKKRQGGVPLSCQKVLNHLFPIKGQREAVLDWLYYALVDRNETALVLNGAKGVGKNVFTEMVRALVGRDNFAEGQDSFGVSGFNSVLANNRIIFLDELRGDKKIHNRLKKYLNKYQTIERKGVDVSGPEATYNSFIIANNDETHFYLEHDDRRFSIPDIATERLDSVMSEEEISELMDSLKEDEDFVSRWGHYILDRRHSEERKPKEHIVKGDKFYRLVYTSLSIPFAALVDFLSQSTEYKISEDEVRVEVNRNLKDYQKRIPSRKKVQDFLANYRHKEEVLATLEVIDDEWHFVMSGNEGREEEGEDGFIL